jgi:hypothetical protein
VYGRLGRCLHGERSRERDRRREPRRDDPVMYAPGGIPRRNPSTLLPLEEVAPEIPDFQAYRGSEPPKFANRAELECAKIFDFYGVPWEYEPRSFPLRWDDEGRVVEAFKPDFYLPEQNLYVEITVMKQSLVTRKNRKIRRVRELYPDVKVKLFYRRDIERLAQRFGLKLVS